MDIRITKEELEARKRTREEMRKSFSQVCDSRLRNFLLGLLLVASSSPDKDYFIMKTDPALEFTILDRNHLLLFMGGVTLEVLDKEGETSVRGTYRNTQLPPQKMLELFDRLNKRLCFD